ncbi:MAG: TonB family protein [Bacteroidota bacterium]
MSEGKNHSEEFERYIKGQMSPEEAYAFERAVLDDPFAREALEGYESNVDALEDIYTLKDRINKNEKAKFPWVRMAVAAVLLIVGSFSVYQIVDWIDSEQELAMEEEIPKNKPQDSTSSPQKKENKEQAKPTPTPIEADDSQKQAIALEKETGQKEEAPVEVDFEDQEDDTQGEIFFAEDVNEDEVVELDIEVNNADRTAAVQAVSADDFRFTVDTTTMALSKVEITPQALVAQTPKLDSNITNKLQGRVAGVQVEPDSDGFIATETSVQSLLATDNPSLRKEKGIDPIQIQDSAPLKKAKSSDSPRIVSGIVTDDTGDPIPGVNVIIKGTTEGTQTDLDGNYELPRQRNMTLVFSYVGFESYEVDVGSNDVVDATMGGATQLQEVVTVGYGDSGAPETSYEPSKPRGGSKEFKKYLETQLQYPASARENEIEGTVTLQLTISSDGSISNIDVKKSVGYGCDEEAIRLVREGPPWRPAVSNGNRVEDKARVKVKFTLKN